MELTVLVVKEILKNATFDLLTYLRESSLWMVGLKFGFILNIFKQFNVFNVGRTFFRLSWFWSICYFFSNVIIISDNCWSRQGCWELWCKIRSMMSKSNRGIWSLARPSGSTCPFLINLSNLKTRAAVSTIMVQKTAIIDLSSDLKFQIDKIRQIIHGLRKVTNWKWVNSKRDHLGERVTSKMCHIENEPPRKWATLKIGTCEKSSLRKLATLEIAHFEIDHFKNRSLRKLLI